MRLHLDDVVRATRGTLVVPDGTEPAGAVDAVTADSRAVRGGELFVPLVAERDGHDFVPAALDAGAAAYLTAHEPVGGTAVVVDDTLAALGRVGGLARDLLAPFGDTGEAAVIGITGSVGKTSVKDLLAGALTDTFRTTASERSFNNEIGVPLTLANAAADTEVVVQEMGARGIGHIASLCRIARPTGAIVTMVAEVHTSEFDGLDAVAEGKGELVEAVPADGFVVLNGSDPRVLRMRARTDARVLTFGTSGDVVATAVDVDEALRPRFRMATPWGSTEVRLGVHGVHQVANALAAAAAALAQGAPLDAVAAGLGEARLSPWRMEMHRTASGAVVVNDAYNANPTALAAALQSLAALDAERRVAVLGVMAELGDVSDERHAEMGALADRLGIDVVTVACPAYGTGVDVPDVDAAVAEIGELGEGDAVLVKASRSAGLQRVAQALLD